MFRGQHIIDLALGRLCAHSLLISRRLGRIAGGDKNVELTEDTITAVVKWTIPDADQNEIDASLNYWGPSGSGLNRVRELTSGKTSIDPDSPSLARLRDSSNAISRRLSQAFKSMLTTVPTEEEIMVIVHDLLTAGTISDPPSTEERNASLS
jgi:hypothetical protein